MSDPSFSSAPRTFGFDGDVDQILTQFQLMMREPNESIQSLRLAQCDLGHGVGYEVLKALSEENTERLTNLRLLQCTIHDRGLDALTATLAKFTSLTTVSLSSCRIDDHIVAKLAEGLKGHRNLTALHLPENHIQRAGCEALATLLRDPECSLVDLDLHKNMIDNVGAKAVAGALAENKKLEIICLDENYITADGWDSFIRILCNTSSIIETYTSNHTLRKIAFFGGVNVPGSRMQDDDYMIPTRLLELVALNGRARGNDPKRRRMHVARQKILDVHFRGNFDMSPFTEGNMDMRLLPHLLSWMGMPRLNHRFCNAAGRTAAYELLRQTPTLCGRNCDCASGHRGERIPSYCKSRFGSFLAKTPKPFRTPKLFKTRKKPKLLISLRRH